MSRKLEDGTQFYFDGHAWEVKGWVGVGNYDTAGYDCEDEDGVRRFIPALVAEGRAVGGMSEDAALAHDRGFRESYF
jgi:hypothetical protein